MLGQIDIHHDSDGVHLKRFRSLYINVRNLFLIVSNYFVYIVLPSLIDSLF